MKRAIEISCTVAGLVFLLSGMLKAFDAAAFAEIIYDYGFARLQFLSPLIILIETFIGLMLIFQIRSRRVSLAGLILILAFTVIYLYGLIFLKIEDCGCFGKLKALSSNPYIILIRNTILAALLAFIYIKGNNRYIHNKFCHTAICAFLCLVCYMSGYTYTAVTTPGKSEPVPISDSPLAGIISPSADSTYLIFAFSYTCPHCMNTIANLNRYEDREAVDKVIAIAHGGNAEMEKQFREEFGPTFEIIPVESGKLTKEYPKSWYIKDNEIVFETTGELPCAQIFKAYTAGSDK